MQLSKLTVAVLLCGMLAFGAAGAYLTVQAIGQYNRYQALLATVDALVQVAQQNIKAGKLDGLPVPVNPPAGK